MGMYRVEGISISIYTDKQIETEREKKRKVLVVNLITTT